MSSTTLAHARGRRHARGEVALAAGLVALAAVAWWLSDRRMSGMSGSGPELGGVAFYVGVWVLMMAAMMFPSITPMVVVYDRLRRARRARDGAAPGAEATALFVGGYLVTWTAAGLAAYAVIALGHSLDVGALAWDRLGNEVVAAVVLAGAAYQLTPLKEVCLRHCRGPFSFVLEQWREGRVGALRMGTVHGGWCVGCCWALMATLFAVGIMSVGWMAFVAALIAIEKLLPAPASRSVAAVLLVLGLAILVAPDAVPGLGAGAADNAMPMDM